KCPSFEAALVAVKRLAPEVQQKGNESHTNGDPIGGLLEVDGAPIAVYRRIKLVHAGQRMHDACIGILRLFEKFSVDPWIGLIFIGPTFLLEPGGVERVDLLVDNAETRPNFRAREKRLLVRLLRRYVKGIER